MLAAFTTFFQALRTLPQRVSWTGPASWYQNRDLHHWLRFNLGTFILFVVPLYSAEFRYWVWPMLESTAPKYTDTPVLGHLQLWCIMTYDLCESATLEPTVQKCVWRMLGSAIGCVTAYLTLLAAGTDNPWVILLSSVIMHFIVYFAAADKDSTRVVFWIRRETFAMEFYVLNRFIASMAGALLCLGIKSWVLPMSAGLASRNLFTRSYGALSASLAAAFTAIDSAAATAHPDPQTTPSVPTTAENTDTAVPNISATEQAVSPLPNLDGALATLAGGEALLAGASFYSKWAHAGPVIVADERLRTVERFLSALSHMAGNVRVVHELYAASDTVERAEQDVGREQDVGTSSTSLLPDVGTAGDSMSLVEGAQAEAGVDPAGSPGTSKEVLEVPHKRLRGVSINLVSARERVLDVIPECVQMFTGVLLSQSEQDVADIPVLSALNIDDKAKADNETALNALVRLQNNATDSSVHPSVEECVMSLLDTSFDLDEGAHAVIQHMYENGAMATTLLALTTAMYLDYSKVCMEFLATHTHTPQRPTIQIALTAHNAKSRHFIRAMKMRVTDEERG
ncbi:hypothetical protein SARC_05344 [Sphaeroforma arctica JP610]|uniref:Integral membrane bound transporter domain-containing protein n=1 Tax=Sphaeroforma arctica JP610 TaxID=667725 RepID=A0A0L0G2F2_9EUKA|nr:hypothetical protein SARC_05344 [Sphaeroforma arctica JP610]KNC82373.1 hypothetical protein SARC_05344 [Sphaeroforma arctica JP610]|eukprot:XP_014156275.1 hypothetical protein SARC_05344 [Sphaeroforma arctica JP610]